jgi:glycine cleavage system H protein
VYPPELRYTAEHEWVRATGDDIVQVGITQYAQEALGDIVYVSLPEVGEEVRAGEPLGEVESTKSVSDIYSPATGRVAARNDQLDEQPDLVNSDPYGDGWMVEIRPSEPASRDELLAGFMDADQYQELVEKE